MSLDFLTLSRPTLAQVVEQFLGAYRQRHRLSPEQASACQSILQCQTEALGGFYQACDHCQYRRAYYCSCGNRHCPQCKQKATEAWLEKQQDNLLEVPYYHLVFTLPHEFNGWARLHAEALYKVLFQAAWQTLKAFSTQHKRFNGQLGLTGVLHTWGQNLSQHIHLHCLVPGIALSPDKQHIELAKGKYLYPISALRKKYRGKLVSLIRQVYEAGELHRIKAPQAVKTVLNTVMKKDWVIYIKPYLKKPETILTYLSRYTYRIALSNQRLVSVDEETVSFRYKDYADGDKQKTLELEGVEFLRRYLQHVLPKGFMRIRHYGFLANPIRKKRLALLRQLLVTLEGIKSRLKSEKSKVVANQEQDCPKCMTGKMTRIIPIAAVKVKRRCWS